MQVNLLRLKKEIMIYYSCRIIPIRTDLVPHVTIKTSNLYGERKSLKGRRKDRTRSLAIREAEMKSGQLKITPGLTLQIYYGPKTVYDLQPQS
jgi:hypothetical protein